MWFDFFFGWRERGRDVCASSRGRDGERCLWVQYYYLLGRTKDLWSSSSKSPDAEICEKRAHIVLILPTSLPQGTDGCEVVCAQS